MIQRVRILDTHTGGEPTRIVVHSPIDLGTGTMAERREIFRTEYDGYRRAIVCEPRGSDVMVGAILVPPVNPASVAGIIFFNNVGFLGMCGHGTIGVAIALAYLGHQKEKPFSWNPNLQLEGSIQQLDTPVGPVQFELLGQGKVRIQNVASYRYRTAVPVPLKDGRVVHGDIAWGGNWFFICEDHGCQVDLSHQGQLQRVSSEIRDALVQHGITGEHGQEVDHIELIGSPTSSMADRKNYVMCPGAAYDRSPCGTGTSAKIACLAADGKLGPRVVYRQESIVGSIFEASYEPAAEGRIKPAIVGSAFVNAEAELILNPNDPFCMGIV
jgi:4-hydroxyproline epimerase